MICKLLLLYGVVGLIASFFVLGQCNLLALEDKTARSLGVNVNKKPYRDFGYCSTVGGHFYGGDRSHQLFRIDRTTYCKAFGRKQS